MKIKNILDSCPSHCHNCNSNDDCTECNSNHYLIHYNNRVGCTNDNNCPACIFIWIAIFLGAWPDNSSPKECKWCNITLNYCDNC